MDEFSLLDVPAGNASENASLRLTRFSAPGSAALKQEIWSAIDELNSRATTFSSSEHFTRRYLGLVTQAEAYATGGHLSAAVKTIWEITFLLNRALESNAAIGFLKRMIMYYGFWLLLLLGIASVAKHFGSGGDSFCSFGLPYWPYAVMGALGGLSVAFWGLIKHSSDLDFNRAFAVWYWLKPLLGAIMGLVGVLGILAGLFAVAGKQDIQNEKSLYFIAYLAGFSERFFIRILDRMMTTLLATGAPGKKTSDGRFNEPS